MLYEPANFGECLYLISAYKDNLAFIATMRFPNENSTIKEYEQWKSESVKNAICITGKHAPQTIEHYSINEFVALGSILARLCRYHELNKEDIEYIPFVGEVSGYDFRELIQLLYDESGNFWEARNTIIEYYNGLLEEIKQTKLIFG